MRFTILACLIAVLCSISPADTGEKVQIGFESGLAAGRLSADAKAQMAKLPVQDLLDRNKGRHHLMADDRISGHWGLDAVLARCEIAPKPYEQLRGKNNTYQTERIVFADTGTGEDLRPLFLEKMEEK